MKESPNFVGKWSLGRRMCGEFELDGEHITVYKTRFGKRAFFGEGKISDGALLLKLSAPIFSEEAEATETAEVSPEADEKIAFFPDPESGGCVAAGRKDLKGEVWIADMDGGKCVVGLKERAFEGCAQVTKISLPKGMTKMGKRAFFGCSGLKSVALPAGICRIPAYAFFGCGALEELILPEGVAEIGAHAFEFCRSLKTISIPASVKRIGGGAFWGCDCLEEVQISDLSAWCAIEFGGNDADPLFHAAELYVGGKKTRFAEIPAGTQRIGAYAFAGSKLEGASIPRSVKSIGACAFEGCTSLSRILYGGTAGEWLAVEKERWANGTGDFCVICTDGRIEKGGTLKKK